MPIYEYRCTECGCEKEYLQKVSDPLKTQCPECGKLSLQKKVTAAGFQLKGSGWYATDFRDGGKKADAKPVSSTTKEKSASTDKSTSADGKSTDSGAAASAASTDKKSDSGGNSSASKSDSGAAAAKSSSSASGTTGTSSSGS